MIIVIIYWGQSVCPKTTIATLGDPVGPDEPLCDDDFLSDKAAFCAAMSPQVMLWR